MPIIAKEFGTGFSQNSLLLVFAHLSAACATWLTIPMMKYLNDRVIVWMLAVLIALISFMGFWIDDFNKLILWSLIIGAAMSIMGTLCNVLMVNGLTQNTLARGLSALHSMYGLGSMVAPLILGVFVFNQWGWRAALCVPAVFVFWLFIIAFKLDNDPQKALKIADNHENRTRFDFAMLTPPLVFSAYVVGEVLCSMWMVSYLISRNLDQFLASKILSLFFLVLLGTRILAVVFVRPRNENTVMFLCLVISACFFGAGLLGWSYGFAAAGILGPFYPLYMAKVNRCFVPVDAKFVTVLVIVSVQLSLALCHGLFGHVSDGWGIEKAYLVPAVMLILAAVGSFFPSRKVLKSR